MDGLFADRIAQTLGDPDEKADGQQSSGCQTRKERIHYWNSQFHRRTLAACSEQDAFDRGHAAAKGTGVKHESPCHREIEYTIHRSHRVTHVNQLKELIVKTVKIAAVGFALVLCAFVAVPVWAAEYTAVMVPDIKWNDAPSIGPGAKVAVIDGDPKSSGSFVMRLKLPPKTKIGVHTHPADENVTVLSGTLHFAAGDKFDTKTAKPFGPGSYFSIAKGKPMFAYTTDKETVLQLNGTGPWGLAYLDPADGSAKKK